MGEAPAKFINLTMEFYLTIDQEDTDFPNKGHVISILTTSESSQSWHLHLVQVSYVLHHHFITMS